MTTLDASQARIPSKTFNNVVYKGARVRIVRRGGDEAYLISADDLKLLEALEDRMDLEEAREALARHEAGGGRTVSLDDAEARLGA